MTNTEVMQLILKTYKFEIAVPQSTRMFFLESSKINLILILKKFGKCGIITVCAINVLFFVKKLGLTLTLAKIYVVVVVSAVFTAGAVATVSAVSVKKYLHNKSTIVQPAESLNTTVDPTVKNQETIAVKNDTKPVSKLKQLFIRYKHVEKVHLKDGTILSGVILEKGSSVEVVTPEGTLNVMKEDIESVEYLTEKQL